MGMLSNGPQCSFQGRAGNGQACAGRIHQYHVQMKAKLDGTPVIDAPVEKTYICEGHYPDVEDPKFLRCSCELCKGRARNN